VIIHRTTNLALQFAKQLKLRWSEIPSPIWPILCRAGC